MVVGVKKQTRKERTKSIKGVACCMIVGFSVLRNRIGKKTKKYISRVVCCMIVGFTVLGNWIRKSEKKLFQELYIVLL